MTKSKGVNQERGAQRISFRLALNKEINDWIIANHIPNKTKFINDILRDYIKSQAK